MKKFYSILLFCLLAHPFFSTPVKSVQEYTLENGMQVFLLEDPSDAQVHIEYTCRAGFSSQTQSTCGFFKLYTMLVKAAAPKLSFTDVQCNADSSRYIIEVSPSEVSETLFSLSDAVFAQDFPDEILKNQLNLLKKEVNDNKDSMSVYINAAIDSRVFSEAPWKHDSGIYPPVFKKTTEKTARTVIKQISEQWYTPKNSAVFISGNINTERTLLLLRNSFGRYYSNFRTPVEKPASPVNRQRKYVLHSNEISPELTQLVIQYTLLDMEQSDLLSLAMGYEGSLFKQQVLSFEELNIPGDEYINVSAAHKKDSSRLIIQTLLQPPENKKLAASTNSFKQTELFLKQLTLIPHIVQSEEFEYAKNQLEYSLNRTAAISSELMKTLSEFWAVQPYFNYVENDIEDYNSQTARMLMSRTQKLRSTALSDTITQLQNEEPFIFVIINSKDYKANKKAYTAAGFEEINEKNASWYVQQMFKDSLAESLPQNQEKLYSSAAATDDNSYYQKNLDQTNQFTLSNGITVYTKQNPLSEQTSLVLSIKGGKLNSADDNGFEEVMINLTAGLIQKKLISAQAEGLLTGAFYVSSQTALSTGNIIVEFDLEDTIAVLKTISEVIVYGEIAPADADRAVASRKYRKRLENGTAANQMYSSLINKLYGKGNLSNIFEAEKEILLDTDYTKILSAYPQLLDASRYSVIICGALYENLPSLLEETLGQLSSQNTAATLAPSTEPDFSKAKNLSVRVRHTFLTDIPAEKAGPQPAVLIPTTEFLDPVIYANKAPEPGTKQAALYNAVLNYIGKTIERSYPVTVQFPRSCLNIGSLTIQNVSHTRELDSQYKTVIQTITEQMQRLQAKDTIIKEIKNSWILNQMTQTGSDTGTALLIQNGLELFTENPKPHWYLEEYNYIQTATAQDFLEIMEYFPVISQARVYSSDSKK
ncbi:zinc protease [Treponema bryantii]|uniref:Zinc protease n=1 Tax=Treponema bryantii TaxID=163 RepID=A0A1I3N4L9_9SPIR|nr:insulinase family protein [Treponema bryantii]SFJ04147.1 zinc protease [Treponema bryantii]